MAAGMSAMMPAMMISEAPLPTPYSVISSPSHMTRIAPPVRDSTTSRYSPMPGSTPGAIISRFCRNTPV